MNERHVQAFVTVANRNRAQKRAAMAMALPNLLKDGECPILVPHAGEARQHRRERLHRRTDKPHPPPSPTLLLAVTPRRARSHRRRRSPVSYLSSSSRSIVFATSTLTLTPRRIHHIDSSNLNFYLVYSPSPVVAYARRRAGTRRRRRGREQRGVLEEVVRSVQVPGPHADIYKRVNRNLFCL